MSFLNDYLKKSYLMKTFPNLILDVVNVHSMPEWLLIISPVAGFHKRGEGQFATSVELQYFVSLFYTTGIRYIKQCLY